MTKPFDSLDDAFNVAKEEEVVDITPTETESTAIEKKVKKSDVEKDYEYSRGQLYSVIEKMQETLNGAMEVASQSDHPRAFEVAFAGAKHLADVVDKLQGLHKTQKSLEADSEASGGGASVNNGTVNNVYMTGTTADMLKMLKEAQEQDK